MIRHKIYHTILVFFGLTLLFACNPQRNADQLLHKAQALLETKPDSAMILIDSIFYPENSLRKEGYRQYTVTKVQAMYMTDKNIKYEDDIFEAQDYYNKKANLTKMIALSNLYSGCVLEEKDEKEQAMNAYKLAFEAAIKTGDSLIMGRIQQYMGRLLNSQGLHEKAIDAYRKAAYINKGMPEKQANNFSAIGRSYLIMEENDSAFFYFEKGIEIAKQSDKQEMLCQLYQNLGIAYRETGDYEEAIKYQKLSIQMNIDSTEITRYNLNFAKLYLLMDKSDSCTYYESLLKTKISTVKDEKLLASIYSFLSKKAVSDNQYDSAYYYVKKYSGQIENITKRWLEQSVFEVQEKYDYEKVQNEYKNNLIVRQRWLTSITFLLLIMSIIIILSIHRLFAKKKKEEELKDKISKMNQEIMELMKKQAEYKGGLISGDRLRKYLRSRLDLVYDISKKEKDSKIKSDSTFQKTKEMVYGPKIITLQDAVFNIFHETYPGYNEKIRIMYPDLNETELKVCILSFLPLSVIEISELMNQSEFTVAKARTNIRKKIGLEGTRADFCEYIAKKINM